MSDEAILLAEDDLPSLSDVRAARVRWALSHVGLDPGDAAYLAAVYPHDHPSRRAALARHQSGCGIVDEAAWEAAGVRVPGYELGYDRRGAGAGLPPISAVVQMAQRSGAWVDPVTVGVVPLPGDALVLGCASCPGVWSRGDLASEHVAIVVATRRSYSTDACTVHSVDGGQPGIRPRSRSLVWCGRELWSAPTEYAIGPDGRPTRGRRVLGWASA